MHEYVRRDEVAYYYIDCIIRYWLFIVYGCSISDVVFGTTSTYANIGKLIPEGDRFWDNYVTLLCIMDHVFAPVTTISKADYIDVLVEDFLAEFNDLYPDQSLIPKMHIMVHFGSWIKQ